MRRSQGNETCDGNNKSTMPVPYDNGDIRLKRPSCSKRGGKTVAINLKVKGKVNE